MRVALLAPVIYAASVLAQAPAQLPPRDARPAPRAAAAPATITGRVVTAGGKQPGRNAAVLLRPVARDPNPAPASVTDGDGRFTLSNVPPGAYTLSVVKTAYLPTAFKPRRDGEGERFEVRAGETLDVGILMLRRGSVITGRAVDEQGEPAFLATVSVVPYDGDGIADRQTRQAAVDDRGQFRVFGLPPADYIVWVEQARAVSAKKAPGTGDFAPTYYPGTSLLAEARPVTVGSEQEIGGIDLVLQSVPKVRVSGTVTDSAGAALAHGSISLGLDHPAGFIVRAGGASLDAEGRFELANVHPGDYLATVVGRVREGAADAPEAALVTLRVAGEPVTDVTMSTRPGVIVSGRVLFEGAAAPVTAGGLGALAAAPPNGVPLKTTRFEWKDDGSFELRGLYGRLLLRWQTPPAGWAVKALRLAGRDVANEALDFLPGAAPVGPLDVVLVRR